MAFFIPNKIFEELVYKNTKDEMLVQFVNQQLRHTFFKDNLGEVTTWVQRHRITKNCIFFHFTFPWTFYSAPPLLTTEQCSFFLLLGINHFGLLSPGSNVQGKQWQDRSAVALQTFLPCLKLSFCPNAQKTWIVLFNVVTYELISTWALYLLVATLTHALDEDGHVSTESTKDFPSFTKHLRPGIH